MKCKRGLGVLLLTALLGGFGAWFLPARSSPTDILLLLSRTSFKVATATKFYEDRNYTSTIKEHLDTSFVETRLIAKPIDQKDSHNTTLANISDQLAVTPTEKPNKSWTVDDLVDHINFSVEVKSPKEEIREKELAHQLSQRITPMAQQPLAPEIMTAGTEVNMTACVCSAGLKGGEILAIVLGAAFLIILLSALFYQLLVFLRNREAKRLSSVYIIENELNKYNLEANMTQLDTKL